MSRYIVVNRKNIAHNVKNPDSQRPVLSLHQSNGRTIYGNSIKIYDAQNNLAGEFVYKPQSPKGCGATVWLSLPNGSKIEVENPQTYDEVCEIGKD
jgi:hypothetical protein